MPPSGAKGAAGTLLYLLTADRRPSVLTGVNAGLKCRVERPSSLGGGGGGAFCRAGKSTATATVEAERRTSSPNKKDGGMEASGTISADDAGNAETGAGWYSCNDAEGAARVDDNALELPRRGTDDAALVLVKDGTVDAAAALERTEDWDDDGAAAAGGVNAEKNCTNASSSSFFRGLDKTMACWETLGDSTSGVVPPPSRPYKNFFL